MTQIRIAAVSLELGIPSRSFSLGFTLGRDASCDFPVDAPRVSRLHAAVSLEDGRWWVCDLGSTNGLYLDGQRIEREPLIDGARLQLGLGGPELSVQIVAAPEPIREPDAQPVWSASEPPPTLGGGTAAPPPESVTRIMERYFDPRGAEEGGHQTRMMRQAYSRARKRDRRPWMVASAALVALLVASVAGVFWQQRRLKALEAQAGQIFLGMREDEVAISNFRRLLEDSSNEMLRSQLVRLVEQRDRRREEYEGYVEQLGFYRRLRNDRERAIYRMARTFGESEFSMDGDFVRAVEAEIDGYWLKGAGRARFQEALERGRRLGYTPLIRRTLVEHGLPAEFFYLALQESDLIADNVGPATRFGRAKGMWQFIPSTARRYGLDPGPRPDDPGATQYDQRLDARLASDAAAQYLRDLHAELTQASGLLVMAAYNWGEHRIEPRLSNLDSPDEVFKATFADVPQTPQARNYWRFLGEYGLRMPEETKDYVLKIFSAAVLGSNPALFGLDLPDPLHEGA